MIQPLRTSIIAIATTALLLTACKESNTGSGTGTATNNAGVTASTENPNTPIAKYNDQVITLKDVDAKIAPQLKQFEKQKLELRQQAAEQIALEALAKAEAAKVGQTDEQWVKAQLEAQLPTPSEAEILKVFEENKARMPPGSTVESMREQIIGFLNKDKGRDVAMKLFDSLKTKANYQLLLEEPRVQVEAKGPSRGPEGAKVTIVEFSDFECPFCSKAEETVSQVMEKYAGKVRLHFRHFPLSFHPHAPKAAEAAACAADQGKFWEMHKVLFANQKALSVDELKQHAVTAGLEKAKFD